MTSLGLEAFDLKILEIEMFLNARAVESPANTCWTNMLPEIISFVYKNYKNFQFVRPEVAQRTVRHGEYLL